MDRRRVVKREIAMIGFFLLSCNDTIPGLCKVDSDCGPSTTGKLTVCYEGVCMVSDEPGDGGGQHQDNGGGGDTEARDAGLGDGAEPGEDDGGAQDAESLDAGPQDARWKDARRISGQVTLDGAVLQNVKITLGGESTGSAFTNNSGGYSFEALVAGDYTLIPSLAGHTFRPSSLSIRVGDRDVVGQDFAATAVPRNVSGSVKLGGTSLPNVDVSLTGATTRWAKTDPAGNYTFTGVTVGTYVVAASMGSYSFSPVSRSVMVGEADVTGQDFDVVTFALSGKVTGLLSSNVSVELSGSASRTAKTDSSGNYSFGGLLPGPYSVTPSAMYFTFTPGSRSVTISNANAAGQDFSTSAAVTEFTVPTADSQPSGIAVGPDGNLWFTENNAGKIGRMTPEGTFLNEFTVATMDDRLTDIVAGPDGNLWFTEIGRIGKITTSGVVTKFLLSSSASASGITVGPDGNLWFAEVSGQKIGRITTSGDLAEYALSDGLSFPDTVLTGPDGNLWFTESGGNRIGKMSPQGILMGEYALSVASSNPGDITVGPDGNLWFSQGAARMMGKITTGGVITEFSVPESPGGLATGPDGYLWYGEYAGLTRMSTTGSVVRIPIPAARDCNQLVIGPASSIYFTDQFGNKIGRLR